MMIKHYDLLKLTAIYTANGSGKSNFIKATALLRQFVWSVFIPYRFYMRFKIESE